MPQSAPVNSISTSVSRPTATALESEGIGSVRMEAGAALASLRAMAGERLYHMTVGGTLAIWLALPLFQVGLMALLYRDSAPGLLRYMVVAQAAHVYVLNSLFFVGEILDRERVKGTLVALFLAPCQRFSWLSGFIVAGLIETTFVAASILTFGHWGLDVDYHPNVPAVALTMVLFLASLWGMGVVFSGIGLLIRKANPLSNLLHPFAMILGGAYFPVAQLPDPLRYVARALPLGYGTDALADAMLAGKGVPELLPSLLPLAGFAVFLPLAGILSFTWLERLVRERGELDLY